MPRQKKVQGEVIPPLKMQEMGFSGLRISNGQIFEDSKRELRFPNCIQTYAQMQYDPTIAAALELYDLMFSTSEWKVKEPQKANDRQKERTEFIRTCMDDMTSSWRDLIQEIGSFVTYGFSLHEKVYRKRLKQYGSKYNDGRIGWKKLAGRAQETIDKWIFEGNELVAARQNITGIQFTSSKVTDKQQVIIPRSKFLLFRTGKYKDNPEGSSILKKVYIPWRYRCSIEETEAIGIQRDLSGLPAIFIPPQYMSADASPDQKAIYEYYKSMARNIQNNEQGGVVMPMAYDPDSKMPLFKFELLGSEGKKNFDTGTIIQRYDNKILTAMGADILILGQSATGSYNLASIKQTLVNMSLTAKLQEIADIINNDLIPQTFSLNGWDEEEELPQIYFEELGNESLEEVSKYLQRIASTGLIEKDREVLNFVRETLGIDPLAKDLPPQEHLLTGVTSKSGEGMKTPFEGTRTSPSESEGSDSNLENVA